MPERGRKSGGMDEYRLLFLKPPNNEENVSILTEAFEATYKFGKDVFNPQWITQEECMQITRRGKDTYICYPFSGPGFEHLKSVECRIYGPLCMLAVCNHNVSLPQRIKHPVFNLAMKGIKICCTSLDKPTRVDIIKKVNLMGGQTDVNLSGDVTHLVAGEVGSTKYKVSMDHNKTVMVKDWVFKVWDMSQIRHIAATDECFDKFKCPPFLGLTIVVSGFGSTERNHLKNFIIRGGGKYSGELKMSECTHLIVKKPEGAKYKAAKDWKIKIIKDKWLYDCMDKKRALETEPYEYYNSRVQTSTPEKERRSVSGLNLSNISTISGNGSNTTNLCIDETTNMTAMNITSLANESTYQRRCTTIGETKLGESSLENDVTVASRAADVFLDDCKIYFSGIRPALEEKLKKVVLSGGGLRTTQLSESVTHVVVGEMVNADITKLKAMAECPYLVTAEWLMDCFTSHSHLNETPYKRLDLGFGSSERQEQPKSKKEKNTDQEVSKDLTSTLTSQDEHKETPSDLEMAEMEMLSQYLAPPDAATPTGNRSVQEKDEARPAAEDEEAATQDPSEIPFDEELFFTGKTFTILGFNDEECEGLSEMIENKGGEVHINSKQKKIIDIAIVPLMGFPVDATVTEVLTNGWLQLCIERDAFVEYDESWVSRPFELPDNEPLLDCCITISGYIGVERQCIIHLASSLGATCQDLLAKKANKSIKANTHLIAIDSSGSKKYDAARKWGLHVVGKEWLLACLSAQNHVPEQQYDIVVLEQKQSEAEMTVEPDQQMQSNVSEDKDLTSDLPELETTAKDPIVEIDVEKENVTNVGKVPSSSCESTTDAINTNPMAQVKRRMSSANSDANKSLNISRTDSNTPKVENISTTKTPLNLRKQVLTGQNSSTPAAGAPKPTAYSTPYGLIKGGGATPGTFLAPGFKPKFNLYETPECEKEDNLNKSTPLGEVFRRQLNKALSKMEAEMVDNEEEATPAASQSCPENQAPLAGVVISVAKKLGSSLKDYHTIAVELGGDYSWKPGDNVTHFVFQGRVNDTNKEFRKARDDLKIIVSPYWLHACKEQNCRVDESLYPHNFNPNQFLSSVTPRRGVTPRSTRARTANVEQTNPATTATPKNPATTTTPKNPATIATPKNTVAKADPKKEPVMRLFDSPKRPGLRDKDKSSKTRLEETLEEDQKNEQSLNITESSKIEIKDITESSRTTDPSSSETTNDESNTPNKNQEMKKVLTEALGNVLSDTSRSNRSSNRRKGKRLNVSGQLGTSENLSSGSPWMSKESKGDISHSDIPQSIQVTWDDPTGRLEEEKLADKLALVCEPSQNTEDMMAMMTLPGDSLRSTRSMSKIPTFSEDRSPTPEPPSLVFPVARPVQEVMSPQPVELLSEESSDSRIEAKPAPFVLVSGFNNEEKMEYSALIEQLGGTMMEQQYFDSKCTHLIVGQPSRNEKFLACLASGKWVLHKSYLEACRKENKFVPEEMFEWGSRFTMPLMQNMTGQANKLAAAAHKWRKRVASMKKTKNDTKGAFDNWKVLLCLGSGKQENFSRLLAAGGADVTIIRPPFQKNQIQGTHCFIDLSKVKIPEEDLEKLLSQDIHCMKPEFIPSFLTDDPPPDPSDFYPPDIKALIASNPQPTRRKRQLSNDESRQRSKMQRHL